MFVETCKMKSKILSATKYGSIMGVGFCLYTTFMWLTKLDTTYLSIGRYLDIAIIILPISMISFSILNANKARSLKILERILIAVYVGLISYVIYQPFLYAYHHYINPTWFDAVLNLKKSELESGNFSSQDITSTLNKMKDRNLLQDKVYSISTFVASVIILPTFISLLSLLYIREKRFNHSDENVN